MIIIYSFIVYPFRVYMSSGYISHFPSSAPFGGTFPRWGKACLLILPPVGLAFIAFPLWGKVVAAGNRMRAFPP